MNRHTPKFNGNQLSILRNGLRIFFENGKRDKFITAFTDRNVGEAESYATVFPHSYSTILNCKRITPLGRTPLYNKLSLYEILPRSDNHDPKIVYGPETNYSKYMRLRQHSWHHTIFNRRLPFCNRWMEM